MADPAHVYSRNTLKRRTSDPVAFTASCDRAGKNALNGAALMASNVNLTGITRAENSL